jgi:hypothetical protein
MSVVTETRQAALPETRSTPRRRFWLHFVEMVVAMVVGMFALVPVFDLITDSLGWSDLFARADMAGLVMATSMTIGMAAWMRIRGCGWPAIAEMGAAMYLAFVVLFPLVWLGIISGMTMMIVGHVLMLPAMLGAMLLRKAEYSMPHRPLFRSRKA